MEAKIVIFFLLLISKRLTAARPVIDFEKKILILEFKKGANTKTNKSKKYNKTSVLCSRYSSLAKNIFLSNIIEYKMVNTASKQSAQNPWTLSAKTLSITSFDGFNLEASSPDEFRVESRTDR